MSLGLNFEMSLLVDLNVDAKIATTDTEQVEIIKEENSFGDCARCWVFSCSHLDAESLSAHT